MTRIKKVALAVWLGWQGSCLFALDTTIKGGTMELRNQGETVNFSGGVMLKRGSDSIKSRTMQTNKTRDQIRANGKVEFTRVINNAEKITGFGARGYYETKGGAGWLEGEKELAHTVYVQVVSATCTRTVDIYARRIDFDKEKSVAWANGDVYGLTVDPDTQDLYEFWADTAHYQSQEKKIVLSGLTPARVKQTADKITRHVTGDKVTYFFEAKKFFSEGNAKAILTDESQ